MTAWGLGPQEVDGGTSASGGAIWSAGVTPGASGLTLVRIRGFIRVILTAAAAAGDGFFGAFGIGLVTDEAFAAGVTAVPLPLSDDGAELWMVHQYFDIRSVTATLSDGVNGFSVSKTFEIDSKAMRKEPVGMTLYGATEVTESGTAVIEVQAHTRTLVKLP